MAQSPDNPLEAPDFAQNIIDGLTTGVSLSGDSLVLSDEAIKLLRDSVYRAKRYPSQYPLDSIPGLLEAGDIQMALWYLINIYIKDPVSIRVIAYELANVGITGRFYLNSFYTYVLADPEIISFSGNRSYIADPIALEQKLKSGKELAKYADYIYIKTKK